MKEIIMYTSETCPHCKIAKDYLQSKGFKYVQKNITSDPVARQELMAKQIMGVPAFIIGDESIVGLDRQRIEQLLDYTVEACPSCKHRTRVPKGKGTIKVTCKACAHQFVIKTQNM